MTFCLDCDFVFPITLLPLAVLMNRTGQTLQTSNKAVQGYVDWILRADNPPPGSTYLPLVRLPHDPEASGEVLSHLEDLSKSTRLFSKNRDAYRYLLSELIDNIYEHSSASRAYVMAQYYPRKGLIEASFMDDGITIPGSLQHARGTAYGPQTDYLAIIDALKGRSAKGGDERGFGLRSCVRVVNALGGDVLIVSGSGAVVSEQGGQAMPYRLTSTHKLEGTLVGLRLRDEEKTVNLYSLVEG